MKRIPVLFFLLFIGSASLLGQRSRGAVWLTDADQGKKFELQKEALQFKKKAGSTNRIVLEEADRYQEIDGFGFALTGGSAGHLMGMSAPARQALLRELFGTAGNNIGMSYLRLSIGASDLNEKVFSYCDLPEGQVDPELLSFNLGPDKLDVIPVLKEILAINPDIKIMASPWSPPRWMKTNNDSRGGQLKYEFYPAYANYFVKYIQAMKAEGISIDAITVQNEPLHPGNNPSLLMVAPDQALFVKKHLGPAFQSAGIKTKIIVYDHNADRPDYPIHILNDPEAKKYVHGSAFHLYGGKIDALSEVHKAHPDKGIYFTEQWFGAPGDFQRDLSEHVSKLIIGASRNWSRTVIEWNLTSNPQNKPHTDRGGCDRCSGGITINKDLVTRNAGYYVVAHASKFVRPGARRIGSTESAVLPNVAFKTADGKTVLIVINTSGSHQKFTVSSAGRSAATNLNPGAVATYVW